ncbi:MAG: UDP-glucose/GDP-mannose dehydrogenase family protein [Nitrospinota bacterium]|jgi:UDPglucose 6-dehydrogenase|nr:UDP-glucose/GDP-mannose dehydrogenase family protein [Nitrospinota bacterium]
MEIGVIGVGYVGLVTGAVFADLGNDVICADIDKDRIERLNRGEVPIYETGLDEMIHRNVEGGRLTFTIDVHRLVRESELIFICVGTPPKDGGETDLSYVERAAQAIAHAIDDYKVIVNKSTVPVGTGALVSDIIERHKRKSVRFDVVSNPEFLREGSAIQDTLAPDRIVIGAPNKTVAMRLLELYAPLERPMLITDVPSAEIIKYASNAFLAMKISFINAVANVCEQAEANVDDVAKGMGYDARIGRGFLYPGLGFGGSCFPKDVESFVHKSGELGYDFKLLKEVLSVNRERAPHLLGIIRKSMGSLEGKVLGVLGLAFKDNTDDMRDAKSVEVIRALLEEGAKVKAYDPVAMDNARSILNGVEFCPSAYAAAEGADALVVVTEWREFRQLNLVRLKELMARPLIFDGRNIYDVERTKRLGFEYHCMGKA